MARLRTRLIAAIVSPFLFFGVLEAGLQIGGYRYRPDAAARAEEARRLPSAQFERHPDLLWTLRRSTVIHEPEAGYPRVVTNSIGLRGEEPPGDKKPDELRVICLGDSVTFGLGVRDEETWPARLAEFLAASPELEGRRIHVLNAGVPGWTSVQGMRLLDRVGWYEPDFVVFWFGMNDVQAAWGRPDSDKLQGPAPLRALGALLSGLRTFQLLGEAVDSVRRGGEEWTRASPGEYRAAVERLQALEAGGGPKVIFIRCPSRIETTRVQLAAVVARADETGVGWVAGPAALLLAIAAAPADTDLTGRVEEGPEGPELRFGRKVDLRIPVDQARKNLADATRWARGLESRRALLPEGALGEETLFGDADPDRLYADNCHLRPLGCLLAARAIAAEILSRLR